MLDFDDIKVEFESQGFRCSHLGVGPERGKAVRWFFRFYFAKEQFKEILIFFGILGESMHSAACSGVAFILLKSQMNIIEITDEYY